MRIENFDERVENVVNCLNGNGNKEDALYFMKYLENIINGACVLATYAGSDEANDGDYGFGSDSYEMCDKYLVGGMELAEVFGTEDFYNEYDEYFKNNIKSNKG